MRDVGHKLSSFRKASAVSLLKVLPQTIERIKNQDLPKKDVLAVARTAGLLAAKKTPDLIPYCHPIPLDSVEIHLDLHENAIEIRSHVAALWKTGVEMEALTAATVTALNLYDLLKPVDKEMEILHTRLESKVGGKSDFAAKVPRGLKAAVLVTSDGTAAGKREDKSGFVLVERLKSLGVHEIDYKILPDDCEAIKTQLLQWCESEANLILTTGGTGMGPRDVTVEATAEILEREMPAVMQAIRDYGQQRTPYAMLSRGLAGVRAKTLLINLPGSSRGAAEGFDAVFPALLHVYPMLNGGGH